ncbi:hypothetical protein HPB51_004329 [Rhipicephalus microplus]|uniref:Uncharacterized protein n=1 Tax=Rhipicephalus microplus TaxID=6941 RepID=A0A9J6EM08_RHIMP|nr:hypothetical protein HPB51_004329 [Rhipicephalus microplus]
MSSSAPINVAAIPEDQSSLRDLIREIVREELQKFRNPVAQTPVASVAELVRDEIRHAFSTAGPGDEHRPMSYADALRRSPSGTSRPYHPVPTAPWSPRQEQTLSRPPSQSTYHQASTAAPWTSSQKGRLRRPPLRRTDAWRTIDRRRLCFNCGGADSSTNDQAAYDDDRQGHPETLFADNARLHAELNSLGAELNRATTSEQCETLYKASHNVPILTERVTTPTHGLHHSVPADTTMSSGLTRSPSLNDGANQDVARPAMPTVSTHEGEPSMAQILAALVNTQALLANMLSRGPSMTSPIEIHSTSDTSSSIPWFYGTPHQSAHKWIGQVERIVALAHGTPSLTLVTAASRLTGFAKDWHSVYSSQHDNWEQ